MLTVDFLQHGHELLDGIGLEFALAQIGLVDEELDLCLLLLGGDALEGVGGKAGSTVEHSLLVELRGGDDAVGNLHGRNFHLLLAYFGIEGHIHFALKHLGHVLELALDGVDATKLIADTLVVAHHLFALESGGGAACHLPVAVMKLGDDADDGFLVHVLSWEFAIDGGCDESALCLERTWGYVEVIGSQRTHSGGTGCECQERCC